MALTIRQAFSSFYVPNHPDLQATTSAKYSFEILRWERHTADPDVSAITTATFNQFRASALAAGLKPITIEATVRTVLQVLRLCGPESERRQGLGLIPRVPYVGRPLRTHTPMRATPSVNELKMLCLFARYAIWPKGTDTEAWWRAWIGVAFVTGLRLTDMLRLSPGMLKGDVLTLAAHKTGAEHVFVVPDYVIREINRVKNAEQLLPSRWLPCFIRRELRRLSSKVCVQLVTPHGIRRASITAWSIINSDCGAVIHGNMLRQIRSRYIVVEDLLRRHVEALPRLW